MFFNCFSEKSIDLSPRDGFLLGLVVNREKIKNAVFRKIGRYDPSPAALALVLAFDGKTNLEESTTQRRAGLWKFLEDGQELRNITLQRGITLT